MANSLPCFLNTLCPEIRNQVCVAECASCGQAACVSSLSYFHLKGLRRVQGVPVFPLLDREPSCNYIHNIKFINHLPILDHCTCRIFINYHMQMLWFPALR